MGATFSKSGCAAPLEMSFKSNASNRHIGPMAQDFYAAFKLGTDDKHIATVDADGVGAGSDSRD